MAREVWRAPAVGLDVGDQGGGRLAPHGAVGVPLHRRQAVHAQEQVLTRNRKHTHAQHAGAHTQLPVSRGAVCKARRGTWTHPEVV